MIQTTMMTTTTTTMAPTSEDWSWLHPLAAAAGGELLSDARVRALVTVMHDPHTTGAQRTAARNELVTANLRLVIMQAKRFLGHGLPLEDLVQEGTLGLMRACETYNPDQARFSTYAHWWIFQALARAVAEKGRLIRLPAWLDEQATLLGQEERRLLQTLAREPTQDEVSAAFVARVEHSSRHRPVAPLKGGRRHARAAATEARVTLLQALRLHPASLDHPISRQRLGSGAAAHDAASSRETLGDLLEGPQALTALDEREDLADAQWILDIARYALRQHSARYAYGAPERAYAIFVARALDPDITLASLAERFHLSRERVRQIEMAANEVVRKALLDCGVAPRHATPAPSETTATPATPATTEALVRKRAQKTAWKRRERELKAQAS